MSIREILNLVATGDIEEALKVLHQTLRTFEKIGIELYQHESRLHLALQDYRHGEVAVEEKARQYAQITHALIDLIKQLESHIDQVRLDVGDPSSTLHKGFAQRVADSLRYMYDIGETLIDGSTATLLKAREISTNREVAIKCLKYSDTDEPQEEALAEVGKIRQIKSRHILKLIGAYLHQDPPSLALEYIEGIDLERRTLLCGPCTAPEAADMLEKIVKAVYYLHKKGLEKNNLSAGRMFLDEEEEPMLSPFEVLKMKTNWRSMSQLREEYLYKAPEEIHHTAAVAPGTAAQFALGALGFFLLTGQHLFEMGGPDDFETVLHSRRRFFTEADYHRQRLGLLDKADVPAVLARILKTVLQENPARRYPNLRTLAEKFRAARGPVPKDYYSLREEYANCLNKNPKFFQDMAAALGDGVKLPPGRGARAANEVEWLLRDIFQYLMAVQKPGECPLKLQVWKRDRGITAEVLAPLRERFETVLVRANPTRTPAVDESWNHQWETLLAGIDGVNP